MDTLPIINRTYEVYKTIVTVTHHTEKMWRYSLGTSLEKSVLECLEHLILAKNAPKAMKAAYLLKAESLREITMLKLRLFLELNIVNETKIFQCQSRLQEIGRMLGGWLKFVQSS